MHVAATDSVGQIESCSTFGACHDIASTLSMRVSALVARSDFQPFRQVSQRTDIHKLTGQLSDQ
jgi:hypothetical protein